MIVALDGPDGAGKSTQCREIMAWARCQGVSARTVSKWDVFDAGRLPFARFLRATDRIELRECIAEMGTTERILFLGWMNAVAATQAHCAAEELILLDGYLLKHAASEIILGGSPGLVSAVREATAEVDLVILLDVTPQVALQRKDGDLSPYECGTDPDSRPETFLSHQAALRSLLLEMAREHAWPLLTTDDPAATQQEIRRHICLLAERSRSPALRRLTRTRDGS